jgi:hypothetical protein
MQDAAGRLSQSFCPLERIPKLMSSSRKRRYTMPVPVQSGDGIKHDAAPHTSRSLFIIGLDVLGSNVLQWSRIDVSL